MSISRLMQKAAAGAGGESPAVEDVFSTYLWAGNNGAQTISNGIDLLNEGGLVWFKNRTTSNVEHKLVDTERGLVGGGSGPANAYYIESDTPDAQSDRAYAWSFLENGFSFNKDYSDINATGEDYVSWTFRKASRFFDVVTYTGDGTTGRAIPHNLGVEPGCILLKVTSTSTDWYVFHRSLNGGTDPYVGNLRLNNTGSEEPDSFWVQNPTDTNFYVKDNVGSNQSGQTYVAYLFAHDPLGPSGDGSDGLIACGSYTTDGSGVGPSVDLGWQPQWLLVKSADGSAWKIIDTMRGLTADGEHSALEANSASIENTSSFFALETNGFKDLGQVDVNANVIYIAIRRGPMRPPESGTEVFAPVEYSGNDTTREITSGFVTDLVLSRNIGSSKDTLAHDRIRGGDARFKTNENAAETTGTYSRFDTNTGWILESSYQNVASDPDYITWMFRRAPGFFDVVAYEGTGSLVSVNHNLGVTPELVIVKNRDGSNGWVVVGSVLGGTNNRDNFIRLDLSNPLSVITNYRDTDDTETTFGVRSNNGLFDSSGNSYIAYLFATLPGVSKVGSYTGDNTTTINVDCGFSTGARFVLIKDTTGTGSWYVFDTARGIVAGNDPDLELDTTSAESNYDALDPLSSGFIVNPTSININETGRTYIFLAIA